MAKIPDAESIQRRNPSGVARVVSFDNRNASVGLAEISAGLGAMAERKNEYETSKADLDFLTLKNKTERDAERDDDYGTLDDRYTSSLSNGLGELALNISDTRARAEFVARNKVNIEQGRQGIQNLAFRKEVDQERAGVNKRLRALREVALTGSAEDVKASREAMTGLLNSARSMGYYTKVDVGNAKVEWQNDAAVGRINMMEPEDQVEALKQPFAKNLPSDVRSALQKKANIAVIRNKAVDIVDAAMDKGLDEEQFREQAKNIKDKKLRKESESRFDYDYNKGLKAHAEGQQQLTNEFSDAISTGDSTYDDIPKEKQLEMDANTKQYLRALQAKSVKPLTKSNKDLKLLLTNLASDGQWVEMKKAFDTYGEAGLSLADFQTFGSKVHKGMNPDIDDELKDNKAVELAIFDAKIDDATVNTLLVDVKEWRRKYQERTGNKPDDAERDKFISGRIIKVPLDGYFTDYEKPLFLLEEGELEESQEEMIDEDPEFGRMLAELEASGSKYSPLEIARFYKTRDDEEGFKAKFKEAKSREAAKEQLRLNPLQSGQIGDR